jgi:5-hydroxyisourate hydrolase
LIAQAPWGIPSETEGDMAGYLTTHVLDTAQGLPAAGLRIVLSAIDDGAKTPLAEMVTNADGRTDSPILPAETFSQGAYELEFHAGDYLRAQGLPDTFLDVIPVRFQMREDDHFHVPLLLSPYSFSTYRGS